MLLKQFLLLVLSISLFSETKTDSIYKCDDTKPKVDVCVMYDRKEKSSESRYVIKKNCGKNKICDVGNIGVCVDKVKLKKMEKGCNYDLDCASKYCNNGKCAAVDSEGDCSYKYCNHESACSISGKCQKLAKENDKCIDNTIRCKFGLKCDNLGEEEEGRATGKCVKIGSLDNGKKSNEPTLCKSGLIYDGKCVSVETDGKCDDYGVCKDLKLTGATYDGYSYCKSFTYGDKTTKVCELNKAKQNLWKKYIDEFNDVKLDKINDDKNSLYDSNSKFKYTFGKFKLYKWDTMYYNSEELIARGIIGDDGEVKDDADCELDFFLNINSSNGIKFSYFLFALLVGLFI